MEMRQGAPSLIGQVAGGPDLREGQGSRVQNHRGCMGQVAPSSGRAPRGHSCKGKRGSNEAKEKPCAIFYLCQPKSLGFLGQLFHLNFNDDNMLV